jgi:DNA-binding transcriptional regulator YbjK
VSTRINGVSNSFKKQLAHKELSALKNAITAARAEYSPEVAAHLAMLPAGSPEAAEGARLYNAYMKQVDTERLRQISAEERRRQEELEMQKLQMQYEAEATAKAAQASNQTNSGGKLRSFFAGASVFSMISNVLARCLFII